MADLDDLKAFVAVAQARGFREAARKADTSASRLSDADDVDGNMLTQSTVQVVNGQATSTDTILARGCEVD